METTNMHDFKKEAAKRKVKAVIDGAKKKVDQAVIWGMEHPAEAIALAGLVVGGTKKVSSAIQTHEENKRRDTDYYDPRTGLHSWSKRKLKPKERMMIRERYDRGESYDRILYDMGLLR